MVDAANKKINIEGIGSVVKSHYNELPEIGLKERDLSRIVHMRNFNNWVKSILINKYLEQVRENSPDDHKIIVVDLACGKGGDLLKWNKGKIHHLICADIASTSIEQCKERYESMKKRGRLFSAEFIVKDCSKSNLKLHIALPNIKIDLVSCQFALHYTFESLAQAETMIKNVADLLKKGGFFIATFPDSNKIISCLESSEDKRSFGNEVFRIEFPKERPDNPPLFGDTYRFFLEGVVNCPEFLVHFQTLVRICKKYNLELMYKKSFQEIYEEGMKERESRSLLFQMKSLELYPAVQGASLSSKNEEEYLHAKKYMSENNVHAVKTMSKSEWEAVCLYMAAGFKKVR